MKDIKKHLSTWLGKFIPAFRKIEDVLADKDMSNTSKVKAIKWITLELSADLSEDAKLYMEGYIEKANDCDNSLVSKKYFFKSHDFDGHVFLN
mgnify:CR=1 FL=1|tara:strand:+ start:8218 stop:8496 length:279 start_codon:yes stop_codon:yes gene_type:complete